MRRPAVLLLAALPALTACRPRTAEPPPRVPRVATADLAPHTFRERREVVSTLEAVADVRLAATSAGRVDALPIREGDVVQAGALLLRLRVQERQADVGQVQGQLAAAEARVVEEQARLARDRANYQRYRYLQSQGAASQQDLDTYRTQAIAQEAQLKASEDGARSARAQLAAASERLQDRLVRAPFAGQISDLRVKPGDVLREGDPFTRLLRNDRLLSRITLPSTLADRVQPGQTVTLADPISGRVLATGGVSFIDPTVDPATQSLLVKAEVANPGGRLRNGQRVRAWLELGRREALAVPFQAVTQSAGQSFVYTLGRGSDGRPQALKVPVRLGPLQDGCYPLLDGLQAGDSLITSNLLNLRHRAPVRPQAGPPVRCLDPAGAPP
ncbi:MAG: efflux RND transporter periplasmic adaptor subunit [Prochlorococcaceae cyanobacterium]